MDQANHQGPQADPPSEQQLLQHAAALRALGRRLLQDDEAADDLVQDTYLAALRHAACANDPHSPERRPRRLVAWLTAVAQKLAYRIRRSNRRRVQRETVAARRESSVPAAADVAAETDLLRRIASAVHELPEPFRTVVYLRFWHDLTPTAIAERTDVPLNTVRSRLQRGLVRLRGMLDREIGDRRAWSLPLAMFVDPGWFMRQAATEAASSATAATSATGATAATATTSLTTGALLMKTKWLVGSGLVVLLIFGYWISQPSAPLLPEPGAEGTPSTTMTGETGTGEQLSEPRPAADAAERAMIPAAADTSALITLRGRCVHKATGAPAPGCEVSVRAADVWYQTVESYQPPELVQSGVDGRFTIRCRTTPHLLEVMVHATGAVPMSAWWRNPEAGSEIDVGDVQIDPGCIVSGRIVDTAGALQPGIRLGFCLTPNGFRRNRHRISPPGEVYVVSAADGTFQLPPLHAGTWFASVRPPQRVARPTPGLEIPDGHTRQWVDIVLWRELSAITGLVVDETGAPVPGATVQTVTIPAESWTWDVRTRVETDESGRFRLPRLECWPANPVQLEVRRDGFHTVKSDKRYPWDAKDVRFVLRRPSTTQLRLQVVDANNDQPIPGFAVRLMPLPEGYTGWSFRDWRPRHAGPHQDGRVTLTVKPGTHILVVEPAGTTWAPSRLAKITVPKEGSSLHTVRLQRNVKRWLQVVDGEGNAVSGSRVQLLIPPGHETVSWRTDALEMRRLLMLVRYRHPAWLVQEATTGNDGRLQMQGPPATDYVLRLFGPSHTPMLQAGVVLAAGLGPLRVVVSRGATVVVQMVPAASVARLYPDMTEIKTLWEEMSAEERRGFMVPHAYLVAVNDWRRRHPPVRKLEVPIGKAGTFRIEAAPPGDWKLCLDYRGRLGMLSGTATATLATVANLRDGEVRQVSVDVRNLVPGRLRAQVLLDRKPLAGQSVHLRSLASSPFRPTLSQSQSTDTQGRTTYALAPGRYRVEARLAGEDGKKHWVYSTFSCVVPPGGNVDHVFHLSWCRLRLRILDAAGKPVVGREFRVVGEGVYVRLQPTDANGELILDPVPVSGPFQLATWPKGYEDRAKQTAYIRANQEGRRWMDLLIKLGPLDPRAGEGGKTVELRLPR